MEKSKTVRIDGLGPVLVKHSKRAKRLSMTIKHDRTIRVTVPTGVSFKRACEFLKAKTPWAKKHLERLGKLEQDCGQRHVPPVNRATARAILTARLNYLSRKHGLGYNRVFIRDQKTKWGSCSLSNNINLNVRLVSLPEKLMDYVILHELVHTRFKNHGTDFWAELDGAVPDAKGWRKELRKYGLGVV
jgi:predicted metal-dependent hydrolase